MTTKLAHQTKVTAGIGNGMRTATVTAVTGRAVTISVAGGSFSSGVGVLGSYIPHVGDVVAVFRQDSSWLVLGTLATPQMDSGTTTIAFTINTTNVSPVISFAAPFPNPPTVTADISGGVQRWIAHAINVTTTGFQFFTVATDNVASAFNAAVSWSATAR